MNCCYKCTKRNALCHGKNPDGTWRCREWGIEQDAKEKQTKLAAENVIMQEYRSESMTRFISVKKNGHLRRW